jgi:hypothetical protein
VLTVYLDASVVVSLLADDAHSEAEASPFGDLARAPAVEAVTASR